MQEEATEKTVDDMPGTVEDVFTYFHFQYPHLIPRPSLNDFEMTHKMAFWNWRFGEYPADAIIQAAQVSHYYYPDVPPTLGQFIQLIELILAPEWTDPLEFQYLGMSTNN